MSKTSTPTQHFIVQHMGGSPISRNNAVFLYCKEKQVLDNMNVGETQLLTFQTGTGTTRATVFRHS